MGYPVHEVFAGDVLPIFFSTFDGGTGASLTMTGLAVTDIEIYKDGSVTQRASDAGYTLLDTDGIDFDGITGIHGFSIDTGDNTDAGFYTVGAWFHVVVSAITVDGQTVNFIAAAFRLKPAESSAGVPKVDVSHAAGTAWASGAITAAAVATGAIDADALAADAVTEIWGKAVTEPSAVPAATGTVLEILAWLLALSANPLIQDAASPSTQTLRNRADNADIADATITVNTGVDTTRSAFS